MINDILYDPGILLIIKEYTGEFEHGQKFKKLMNQLEEEIIDVGESSFISPGILWDNIDSNMVHFPYPSIHIITRGDTRVIYYSRYVSDNITLYRNTYENFSYARMYNKLEVLTYKNSHMNKPWKIKSLYHYFNPTLINHKIEVFMLTRTFSSPLDRLIKFLKNKTVKLFG